MIDSRTENSCSGARVEEVVEEDTGEEGSGTATGAEAELAALFIAAREMVPHRQTLIDMGWPQPRSPVQTDNSTAIGVTNKTIVPMLRLPETVSLLLGCRVKELGRLQY
jgi:hypothetical protein